MKVAIFSTTFFPQTGGAERFMHGLATRLSLKGHQVVLIVPVTGEINVSSFPYTVYYLRMLGIFLPRSIFYRLVLFLNLLSAHRRYRFDVLQVVGLYPAGVVGVWFTRVFKAVRLVARATGSDIQILPSIGYGMRLDKGVDGAIRVVVERARALIANSPSVKQEFIEMGADANKVRIIPNALDLERFKSDEEQNKIVRRKWCNRGDARIVLSVGRNEERKNFPLLIQAMEDLMPLEGFQDVYCVIVGEGSKQLKSLVRGSPNEHRFIFVGRLPKEGRDNYEYYPPDEIIDLYLASTIFAFPSVIEGQPNVLLEALAAGLPVIAGDVPGSRDVVVHGKTGLLVDLEDSASFVSALRNLLEDDVLYQRFRAQALLVAQDYNWDIVVQRYLDVYTAHAQDS
jgi:glycosyltransferase involved in cell wall biosynthesis